MVELLWRRHNDSCKHAPSTRPPRGSSCLPLHRPTFPPTSFGPRPPTRFQPPWRKPCDLSSMHPSLARGTRPWPRWRSFPLHRPRPRRLPRDPSLAGWGVAATRMLQTRTHAFRRGGITYLRDRLREKGAHHFDMLHTLLQHGRWKSIKSLQKYLVIDDDHITNLFSAAGDPSTQDHAQAEPITCIIHQDHTGGSAPPKQRARQCSVCGLAGHDKRNCPSRQGIQQE